MIIRIVVAIIVIVALYAAGWYLFTRFDQLQENEQLQIAQELNHPRINQTKIDTITKEFKVRKYYIENQSVSVYITENDPFYAK